MCKLVCHCFLTVLYTIHYQEGPIKPGGIETEYDISPSGLY